jgi:hypothetical protein
LLDDFGEEDDTVGVTTDQVTRFCSKDGISLYALDFELNVFHKQVPNNRSHRFPPLVYVVGNHHMYPIIEKTLRTKIFSQERLKQADFGPRTSFKKEINFDCKKPVVINPELNQLSELSDCNVVFTKRQEEDKCEWVTLFPVVIYLFKTESVIYKANSYNGNILRIHYKNNVDIQLNPDYDSSLYNNITFKNQNFVTLINEMFQTFKQTTRVHSTFNTITSHIAKSSLMLLLYLASQLSDSVTLPTSFLDSLRAPPPKAYQNYFLNM